MHVTLVYVQVTTDHKADFVEATRRNHAASVKEPGNLRFDVLQSGEDSARFVLCEASLTPEAAAAHKQTPHYQIWKETVAPWMASPRRGVTYEGLCPDFGNQPHV
ncbi:MAG: antibiotic biosynthesis monooxygenase [Thiobacillaceae bacterium]